MSNAQHHEDEKQWENVAPLLDAALADLSAKDRRAIMLRFFDGCSLDEVAAATGVSVHAAKQRVYRATLRMRRFLLSRGVNITASTLGPLILRHAVHAAPAHVVVAASSAALLAKASVCASLFGANGLLGPLTAFKSKTAAALLAIVLSTAIAVTTYTLTRASASLAAPRAAAPVTAPTDPQRHLLALRQALTGVSIGSTRNLPAFDTWITTSERSRTQRSKSFRATSGAARRWTLRSN